MNDNWKPGTGQEILSLFVWIATDPEDGEGICKLNIPQFGGWTLLVGSDMARIESFRPYAEAVRELTGYPVRLVKFTTREDLETLA